MDLRFKVRRTLTLSVALFWSAPTSAKCSSGFHLKKKKSLWSSEHEPETMFSWKLENQNNEVKVNKTPIKPFKWKSRFWFVTVNDLFHNTVIGSNVVVKNVNYT